MNRIASRAWITILIAALLIAGLTFFVCEFVAESGQWAVFSGSPHLYNGVNIDCGVVTDRDSILLLDMEGERTYAKDALLRSSVIHWLGDREGHIDAPALPSHSAQIAGFDILNGVYSYADHRATVELTLSASVQREALQALGDRKGTVAVYNYKTGEILCAVTTPTYDPDDVPNPDGDTTGTLEGMYLNRFTQGTYTPGSIFKIVTLAAALEAIPEVQEQTYRCTGSYAMGADNITCEGAHGNQDLKTAFCNSCNCVFAQLAQQLGGQTLAHYIEAFGVTASVSFDGIQTAEGSFDTAADDNVNLGWSAVGQYHDLVNPASFLTFIGAVANDGKGVSPYLVKEITLGGSTTYSAGTDKMQRIMSGVTAGVLREYMQNNVQEKYGADHFPGLTVCAKTGTAEVGGEKKPNAMLAGFVQDEQYPLAFIVCVEDAGYGKTVCIPIASRVLAACKEVVK